MIRRIGIERLRVGMHVHELDAQWLAMPFVRSDYPLVEQAQIDAIRDCGVRDVYIDTERGEDDPDGPSEDEREAALRRDVIANASVPRAPRPLAAPARPLPRRRAREVRDSAREFVRRTLRDARLGRAVPIGEARNIVEEIAELALVDGGALTALLRLRSRDEYTFAHSASVCAMMVVFAHFLGMDADETRRLGVGALLHDTGKAFVPPGLLDKPGALDPEEFAILKRHPRDGYDLLVRTGGIDDVALDIALHHHERLDGTGYPERLEGEEISRAARMAAIVDVYDAITSDRSYHRAVTPSAAMRKLVDWSRHHLDAELVRAFIQCLGVYPVGTLVHLKSGKLAVVVRHQPAEPLRPVVRLVYDTVACAPLVARDLDLAVRNGRGAADSIVCDEDATRWNIAPALFID